MALDTSQPGAQRVVAELAEAVFEDFAPAELKMIDKAARELGIDPQLVVGAAAPAVKHLISLVADEAKETVEPLIREHLRRLFRHHDVAIGTPGEDPPGGPAAAQAAPSVPAPAQPVPGGQPEPPAQIGFGEDDTSAPVISAPPADGVSPAELQLRVHADMGTGHTVKLRPGTVTIGRAPDATIHLSDRTVSHYHAVLTVTTDEVTIEDRGSINGTWLNGTKIGAVEPLRAGDYLQMGKVLITIEDVRCDNGG